MQLNSLIPELYCDDIEISLNFYIDVLGFDILYQRENEGFAMLQFEGAQMMLDQIGSTRDWLTAPLKHPYGRGINLQIMTQDVSAIYQRILAADIKPFGEIEEKTYLVAGHEQTVRQFLVHDPDGYLLRFQQNL